MASLSWGKGCSSGWLHWQRNCDEPCERFCLCALRTDFRVKPSTFSAAEMAALAAPAGGGGGDDDDISAALALGSSGCCLHGTGSGTRRRRRGRGAEELAPLRPVPPGRTALPLPGARRALSSPPADASRPHLRAGGSRSPPLGELPGAGGGGGGVVCEEVVDSEFRGRVDRSPKFRQLRRGLRGRGRRTRLSSLPARVPGRPARQHLSDRCQGSPPCLEPPPEALPSRGPPSRCLHRRRSSLSAPTPHLPGR